MWTWHPTAFSATHVFRDSGHSAVSQKSAGSQRFLSLSGLEYALFFIITPTTFHNAELLHSFLLPKDKAKPLLRFRDRPNSRWQCQKGMLTVIVFILLVWGFLRTWAWQWVSFQRHRRPRVWFSHWGNLGRYVKIYSNFTERSHPFKLKWHRVRVLVTINFYPLKQKNLFVYNHLSLWAIFLSASIHSSFAHSSKLYYSFHRC